MSRQHAAPVLVTAAGASALQTLGLGQEGHGWSEAAVQALIQAHPACLPIAEIDPLFADPVPICTELNTTAGSIDNLMVTASGMPVLVECKLWRNPQARREVVGQILDYAKELSRWSSSDLQREARRRLGQDGDPVIEAVRAAGHQVDEIAFNDALTLNLRRGRFLLLIVGDGIREGVEAIADYLQAHAGLHFTLGLVELPIFAMPDGSQLVAPRVVARTLLVTREVINVPEGMIVQATAETEPETEQTLSSEDTSRKNFMDLVADGLKLSDPEQTIPKVSPKGYLYSYMPVPSSSAWIGVLDKRGSNQIGIRLTSNKNTAGEAALRLVASDWEAIQAELGEQVEMDWMSATRVRFQQFLPVDREAGPQQRERAAAWLRERLDAFVTAFRPRIREAVQQLDDR